MGQSVNFSRNAECATKKAIYNPNFCLTAINFTGEAVLSEYNTFIWHSIFRVTADFLKGRLEQKSNCYAYYLSNQMCESSWTM